MCAWLSRRWLLLVPSRTGSGSRLAECQPPRLTSPSDDPTAAARNRMVQRHLVERGLKNPRVLDAFRTVPRHRFLPPKTQRQAYDDESIPIGEGQTITPPYDVAFMTEVLDPKPTDRVYEVGTGSGYQSAILSRLVKDVYSIEIHAPLSKRATQVHKDLGYTNIHTRIGDGYVGWPEAAPFDAIIVTCAPTKVPQPLFDQLKEGGRMVIPIGDRFNQMVHLIIKKDGKRVDQRAEADIVRADDGPRSGRGGRRPTRGGAVQEGFRQGRSPAKMTTGTGSVPTRERQTPRSRRDDVGSSCCIGRVGLRSCWQASCGTAWRSCFAQEELIERPGPPPVDNLEADENKDGVPDGWYNARDVKWMTEGGAPVGPALRSLRVHSARPAGAAEPRLRCRRPQDRGDRPWLWIRQNNIQVGEREGDEPGLMIDFLGVRAPPPVSRGIFGPWTHSVRDRWTRVAKRIPVPPGTKDAIMSVGLMGATGTLDFDGLTVDLIPVGGEDSTNLVVNGEFELGDPAPASWVAEGDARRVFPGNRSSAAGRADPREVPAVDRLALPVDGVPGARCIHRGPLLGPPRGGGAQAAFFFLDEFGKPLPGPNRGDYCPLVGGQQPLANRRSQRPRAARRGPGGPPVREAGLDRLDPHRRRSRHGLAQPRGRLVDPVPRRR